jgi:hypothetical protein
MLYRNGATVVPLDRYSAPSDFDDGSKVGRSVVPANPITDFELPGLFAGHLTGQSM